MTISLRLNDQDSELIKAYAAMNGISVSELFRRSVLERIEDEYDIAVADEAYKEYLESGKKSRPISELWEEIGE